MAVDVLDVYLRDRKVGAITSLGGDRSVFTFDDAYADDPARTVREAGRNLSALAGNIRRSRPTDASAEQLASLASDVGVLASHPLASSAASELLHLAQDVQAAADNPSRLARAIRRLADRRNAAVHGAPPEMRPAYTLDDED